MRHKEAKIQEAGGRLVVIGNGTPNFMAGFRERVGFAGELYTDPDREAYRALGLRRDLRATLNLSTIRRAYKSFRQGNRQVGTQGDPWQQGGVFVVKSDSEIAFAYASEFAGDHPPIENVLEALVS